MRLRDRAAVALCVVTLGVFGCGGENPAPAAPPAPPPKPRNAASLAWEIVHAKVGALTYVERVRGRPIAAKIQSLDLFRPYLEGTGIHPEQDLDRAFVAAPATDRGDETIVVAQHHLSPEQLRGTLDAMIASGRISGGFIEGAPVPEARLTARGQTRILALIDPDILVLLPEAHAAEAARFVGTGGFADPTGPAAVVASATDPAESVRGPRVPPIPPTLKSLSLGITLGDDGGATLAFEGPSTGPEQAAADASALTQSIDEATSMRIAFVRVRIFKPVRFIAEGASVKADVHLSASEIDTLLSAVSAFVPR